MCICDHRSVSSDYELQTILHAIIPMESIRCFCNSSVALPLHHRPTRNNARLCNLTAVTNCSFRPSAGQLKNFEIVMCKAIRNLEVVGMTDGISSSLMEIAEPKQNITQEEDNEMEMEMQAATEEEEEESISGIPVPRQRYIPISKVDLLLALLSLFENDKDAQKDFLAIYSCLDSILHAEHKSILEELLLDYGLTYAHVDGGNRYLEDDVHGSFSGIGNEETPCNQDSEVESFLHKGKTDQLPGKEMNHCKIASQYRAGRNLGNVSSASIRDFLGIPNGDAGVNSETRFQRNFMQILRNAEFQELSTQDLQLSSALNTDYLLTLPIDVDWKRASSSNAIVFKRGYTTERQEGLLIGEKLDYLQSRLLQKTFSSLSQPLLKTGMWINKKWKSLGENEQARNWTEGIKRWLKEPLWPSIKQQSRSLPKDTNELHENSLTNLEAENDSPIWLAAQQAVPQYENFLSSAGSRGRLLRKLLVWMGLLPSEPPASIIIDSNGSSSDPYSRTNFLSRVSLKDIWKPATKEICENDVWRQLRAAFSVLFSRSTLQEPAFKELVLLYTAPVDQTGNEKSYSLPTLQLKIYKMIPIPDLKVIFPNKKLSFRILDTVRLDIATILGLLAFFINHRFEDFFVSISAFMLDVIAFGALIVFITRAVLGYKQTWDRYELLVNRTLYEKTLASGFGTIHFLVDASEQQQFKEVILAYALLLQVENNQVGSRKRIADLCEHFLYSKFKEQIEMPIDKAMETLLRLGLVTEDVTIKKLEGREASMVHRIKAVPFIKSYEVLKERWGHLLYQK